MSQPDRAHAVVHRARPASAPAVAPLRVVSERVRPDPVAAPASAPGGPAQLRAGFRDASATSAPLTMAPCPQPWPATTGPPLGAVAAPGTPEPVPAEVAPVARGADLVPARSLLPCPAPRPLLARLVALLSGRRDPAGRHRPDSIESPAWSMCSQPRRRSRRRTR